MNGADPYSALHTQQQQQQQQQLQPASFPTGGAGATSSPPAATSGGAAAERSCAAAQNAGYPIMDKHAKPLVGSDTSKAVRFLFGQMSRTNKHPHRRVNARAHATEPYSDTIICTYAYHQRVRPGLLSSSTHNLDARCFSLCRSSA